MVVRVERIVEVPASREQVWEFISDPQKRARAISVVEDFELLEDGRAIWHVALPIPLIGRTVRVETENTTWNPPSSVEFVGNSKILRVVGEHELEETGDVTRLHNRFTVEGKIPGVERFFSRNMDDEFDNLEDALYADLGLTQG